MNTEIVNNDLHMLEAELIGTTKNSSENQFRRLKYLPAMNILLVMCALGILIQMVLAYFN